MNHVLNHIAHAALHGFVYRVVWHSPMVVVAVVLFVIAAAYLSRRYR